MPDRSTGSSDHSCEIIVWTDDQILQAEGQRRLIRTVIAGITRCPSCNGRGVVALLTSEVPCDPCDGTGWVDSPDSTDIVVICKEGEEA